MIYWKREKILEKATIIESSKDGKVGLGSTVTIYYIDDEEEEEYMIVGSKEADPSENKVSNESPLAMAIMGASQGEIRSVESPNGKYDVKIVKVK